MPVSEALYRQLAEADFEGNWELHCGKLRRKPPMSLRHNTVSRSLAHQLERVLPAGYVVAYNTARLRLPSGDHFVPDVVVIPQEVIDRHWDDTGVEAYPEPMPLVVEVWSPSTGDYDATEKVRLYQSRLDEEIWLLDPRTGAVTSFVPGPRGSYAERRYPRGLVPLAAFPGALVDVDGVLRAARL